MIKELLGMFGYGKSIGPEAMHDLIKASEQRDVGWVRILNPSGQFLGFRFYCPGKYIHATRPAIANERDVAGNLVTGNVPIVQKFGCSWSSSEILPKETLADVRVKCGQCGTESNLLAWMRENKIAKMDGVPVQARAPIQPQQRAQDTWSDQAGDYKYDGSNPGNEGCDPGIGGLFT